MDYKDALSKQSESAEKKLRRATRRAENLALGGKSLTPKKKKKSLSLSKLKKLLWTEISLLVRSWSPVCLACKIRPTEVAAHIVPSNEGAMTRYFLPNLYPCCVICNGLEKWNRATWVYEHRNMFGEEFVDALYMMSNEIFQVKNHWVLEQTDRMKKLMASPKETLDNQL